MVEPGLGQSRGDAGDGAFLLMPPPVTQFPFKLLSQPGIKRDGTLYEGRNYTDGLWCRFQRGKPRKMGGYKASTSKLTGISRGLNVYSANMVTYVHNGWYGGIEVVQLDVNGIATGDPVARTPVGFVSDANNSWSLTAMYNSAGTNTAIIGVATPILGDLASTSRQNIWYGDILGSSPLTQLTGTDVPTGTAGGVCFVPPYLFVYDAFGYVTWSAPNTPTNFSTAQGGGGPNGGRISASKVIFGMVSRGGASNSPAVLFWTLDSVVRGNFVGGTAIFAFDTVSSDTSILSPNIVIEYDGVYYWAGLDRFLMYNGVVQELPNDMNLNWFFDGMNWPYHEKSFAFKTPRFGEIGFAYPRYPNTECSHAAIFNVREKTWYDTELPNGGRSAATFSQHNRFPLMAGVESVRAGSAQAFQGATGSGGSGAFQGSTSTSSEAFQMDGFLNQYRLWQHEIGTDEVVGSSVTAIRSYFDTSNWSLMDDSMQVAAPMDKQLTIDRIEPDFNLTKALTITPIGRAYAMSPDITNRSYVFDPAEFDADNFETFVKYVREQRRQMRLRFESNAVGGFYEMGNTMGLLGIGDGHT